MTYDINRRTVLKGIGAGAITLTYAGSVSAGTERRYVLLLDNPGAQKRVENAGFTVRQELAGGTVAIATGPSSDRGNLEDTEGVRQVVADFRVQFEDPARQAPFEDGSDGGNGNGKDGGKPAGGRPASTEESTDEPLFSLQWDKQDGTTDAAIAHDRATGAGRTIAVIDSGIDHDHPDLPNVVASEGRLFRESDDGQLVVTPAGASGDVQLAASSTPVFDEDCNELGLADGTVTEDRAFADDVLDHGTHVAGIAAGAVNDTGIVGTAPDADVIPLRVFYWVEQEVDTDGNGEPDTTVANLFASFGGILTAIDVAATLGVDAMNLSIGTLPIPPQGNAGGIRGVSERVIENATRRGSLVVVSAGNSNANLQQGGFFTWPNSLAGAMSISATGPNDQRVFYSNFGTNEIDVGAPGGGYETLEKTLCADWDGDGDGEYPISEDTDGDCETEVVGFEDCELPAFPFPLNLVLSSVPPEFWDGDHYAFFAGTSMAAPQVTGTAALVREVAPNANAKQVEQAIKDGAEPVPGEGRDELGAGRLNCDRALDADVLD